MSTLPTSTPHISTTAPSPAPSESEGSSARALNRARFELELEFVQALANPYYLQSLAQQGFFGQPEFVNYLKYLGYWRQREYARFIQYPHALHHLELLQKKEFRDAIARDDWREWLNYRQFEHWRTWREPEPVPTTSTDAVVPVPQDPAPPAERRDSAASTAGARRFRTPGTAPATALSTPLPNGTSTTRRD